MQMGRKYASMSFCSKLQRTPVQADHLLMCPCQLLITCVSHCANITLLCRGKINVAKGKLKNMIKDGFLYFIILYSLFLLC